MHIAPPGFTRHLASCSHLFNLVPIMAVLFSKLDQRLERLFAILAKGTLSRRR